INKYYTLITFWINAFKSNVISNDKSILLDNILLDYCSLMHCVTLGDIKLINFLFRNIIESILRYITDELETKDLESLFKKMSSGIVDNTEKYLLQTYASQIKQVYDDTCLYIHTDISKIQQNLTNLIDYKLNLEESKIDFLNNTFNKMNISILNILRIKYYPIYLAMKDNAKGFHDQFIPLEDKIKFQRFLKYKSNNMNCF
ncbi:hypothetical protein ACWJV3_13065, partial [Clostridioides difficile]